MELNPGGFVLLLVGVIAVIVGFKGTQSQVAAALTGGRSTTTQGPQLAVDYTPSSAAASSSPTQAAGTYANPLRDVSNLAPERIDQGVDYGGTGPLHALGPGTITGVTSAGWPGGTFIQELLSSGPAAGKSVYYAEDIAPNVQVGQQVDANSVIGTLTGGPSGIEVGWASDNPAAQQAAGHSQWVEGGPSTAYGLNFSSLLASLGAPAGIAHGQAGTTPSGWPQWLQSVGL